MEETRIEVAGTEIPVKWEIPAESSGIVIFAHGTGSSRNSTRNNFVADQLREVGLGTVLFDLLVGGEQEDVNKRSDMELHQKRLCAVADWIAARSEGEDKPFGFYGSSTGAAVALLASVRWAGNVGAIVSRGGRPDIVQPILAEVAVPTLLIVGERDRIVLEINRKAFDQLSCEKDLAIVEGASHLFEEPGTLDQVVDLTRKWFLDHFRLS
jgi:putative phosphoribosyl transferase